MASPKARQGFVADCVHDHTSILKMIECRWDLPALSVRDQAANNIAEVLDFQQSDNDPPQYDVPPFVSPPCPTTP